ncbi:MAG TPA: hypothetical protein VGC58_02210 [Candidatus Paceibacterota bacterium]
MASKKVITDPVRIREGLEKLVVEKGIDLLMKVVGSTLSKMVGLARFINEEKISNLSVVPDGFDMFTHQFITVGAEVLLSHLKDKKKIDFQADYDYWIANKQQIMELHGITEESSLKRGG